MLRIILTLILFSTVQFVVGQAKPAKEKKNKFWGNDWSVALGYNFARADQAEIDIGRSYVSKTVFNGPGGGSINATSWGLGYAAAFVDEETNHLVKVFAEKFSAVSILGYSFRGEYIYDLTARQHYLRPSIGYSLVSFDVMYNYSFKLNGDRNLFGHGLTLKLRFFMNKDNWHTETVK